MIHVTRTAIPKYLLSPRVEKERKRLEDFYAKPAGQRRQQRFQYDPGILRPIREKLVSDFKNKCAYCESTLGIVSEANIDHFRPRAGAKGFDRFYEDHYYWLLFEWRNMYPTCQNCDRFKQSWFPVRGERAKVKTPYENLQGEDALLLDPCVDFPEEHLAFYSDGIVKPLTEKGEATISLLKLNREPLVQQRKAAIEEVRKNLVYLKTTSSGGKVNPEIREVAKFVVSIFQDNPGQPYAGALRSFIAHEAKHNPFLLPLLQNKVFPSHAARFQKQDVAGSVTLENFWTKGSIGPHNINAAKEVRQQAKKLKQQEKKAIDKVFLKSIEVKNFKAIDSLRLDFPEPTADDPEKNTKGGVAEPWVMLLGENAVGKSTLLQAIALALVGQEYLDTLGLKAKDFFNRRARGKTGHVIIQQHGNEEEFRLELSPTYLRSSHRHCPTFLLAYGSTRLSVTDNLSMEPLKGNVRARNLFHPETGLAEAQKWLVGLYRQGRRNAEKKKLFDWVGRAIKDLLLADAKTRVVVERGEVLLRYTPKNCATLEQLSDGYKSMISVGVDIMQMLIRDKTTMETAQGIVLIDEIGTHLHPRWKMQVVKRLRAVFPKLQFIVTTHDPLCLRGLKKGEIAVFTKTPQRRIQVNTNLPDPSGLNAEQLLESEFFGLDSTYDGEDEERFNEYHYLLSRKRLTSIQEKRKRELQAFVRERQQMGSSRYEQVLSDVVHEQLAQAKFVKPKSRLELKEGTLEKIRTIWKS